MQKRPPKETDQEEIEKAFQLLKGTMAAHPEIEPTLWAGAVWSCLVHGYKSSGFTYKDFEEGIHEVLDHFKKFWDE